MAVSKVKLSSAMVLKVRTGQDALGKDVFRSISLKKVKPGTPEQDIFDVALQMSSMLNGTFAGLFRQDMDEVVNL